MIRPLTAGEWAQLSPGLADVLRAAGADPRIRDAAHPFARVAALWRRSVPILALGNTIHWPDAAADFAGTPAMAILQHELQHVLDYATGALTPLGYVLIPRNWTYRTPAAPASWTGLGAEQRAVLAERLWRAERSDPAAAASLRRIIPWAEPAP